MKKILLTISTVILVSLGTISCSKANLNNLEGDWILTEENEKVERPNGSYEHSHKVYPLHDGEYKYVRFDGNKAYSIKESKGKYYTEAIYDIAVADNILTFNGKNITITKKTNKVLDLRFEKSEKDKTTVETFHFESIPALNYEPML